MAQTTHRKTTRAVPRKKTKKTFATPSISSFWVSYDHCFLSYYHLQPHENVPSQTVTTGIFHDFPNQPFLIPPFMETPKSMVNSREHRPPPWCDLKEFPASASQVRRKSVRSCNSCKIMYNNVVIL